MNFCRLSFARILAGTMTVAGFVAVQGQQTLPSGGRKIEFSDPRGGVVTSNLNQIATGRAGVQDSDDDLKKPLDVFQPSSSLQGIGTPLLPRAPSSGVNSKRLKELLEKRHDWVFLEPEDYQSQQTIEEIFGIPKYGSDGELQERKSPLERYYERLGNANTATTNRTRNDTLFGLAITPETRNERSTKNLDFTGAENEPGEIPEIDNPLKELLRGHSGNPLFPEKTKPTGFFELPGPWNAETAEASRAQAERSEEFKRILDASTLPSLPPSSPISGIMPFDPLKSPTSTAPAFALPGSPETVPVTTATPFTPVSDSLSPFPTTAGTIARQLELPEASKSLPVLTPAPTVPEPTRTSVPAPEFNIPKRRFP